MRVFAIKFDDGSFNVDNGSAKDPREACRRLSVEKGDPTEELVEVNITVIKSYGFPFASKPTPGTYERPVLKTMIGDIKDETVALHGPNGLITSGLTSEQAYQIIEALGVHEDEALASAGVS